MVERKSDVIAVLGYGFVDGVKWQLPEHSKNRLAVAADLFQRGTAKKLVVLGKWAREWDTQGITPPLTEARRAKEELVRLGINPEDVLESTFEQDQDTIGNGVALRSIMDEKGYKTARILCADYMKERVIFTAKLVFPSRGYKITVMPTETPYKNDSKMAAAQHANLKLQEEAFSGLKGGVLFDRWGDRLYEHPYYGEEWQSRVPTAVTTAALGSG